RPKRPPRRPRSPRNPRPSRGPRRSRRNRNQPPRSSRRKSSRQKTTKTSDVLVQLVQRYARRLPGHGGAGRSPGRLPSACSVSETDAPWFSGDASFGTGRRGLFRATHSRRTMTPRLTGNTPKTVRSGGGASSVKLYVTFTNLVLGLDHRTM